MTANVYANQADEIESRLRILTGRRCNKTPECLLDDGHAGACDVAPYHDEDYDRWHERQQEA